MHKQQLIQILAMTMVPDSNTVSAATSKLIQFSKIPNYCMMMMQIADDQNQAIGLRQAALIQFKNTVKKFWSANQYQIKEEQKMAILGVLVPAFMRAANSYVMVKLYKQVVSIIIGFVYKVWMPVEQLCQQLQTQANPVPTLEFFIAIETNFQLSIHDQQRQVFYQFLKAIMPSLSQLIQKNSNEHVIYLIMKIIWKAVHFQVSHELRVLLCSWMDLVLSVAGASNQKLQSEIQQTQQKGTQQFFYFHAKKWATRIIYRFLYKHASPSASMLATEQVKKQNKQFSKQWYDSYGQRVVETIIKQFLVPSIKKTRYFQLKCLVHLINNYPQQMKQYSQSFQYKILPPYLQLEPEDEDLANSDPLQFINREQLLSVSYTFLKKQAKEAWVAFTNIAAKKKKKDRGEQIGVLFQENMAYLKSKLQGTNLLEKQMAMYLICELRSSIKNSEQVKKMLPALVSQYIVPEFTNSNMFLRARSMQIFDEYGDLGFDKSVLKKAVEGIYFCLTGDEYPLVRLKAARAFHVLLQHEDARQQVKPLLQQILEIYLVLMSKYDSEALVFSLSGIVEHFSVQVGPYACELMRYLSKHFIKLFEKDKTLSEESDYDGETELAAAGVLNTMKVLLESPIDKQNIAKMESDVLQICDFVFCSNDADYVEDALSVLRAYTHRTPVLTEKLLFYYSIIVYYAVGIDQHLWPKIQELPIPQINKKCVNAVRKSCQIQRIDTVVCVLRNYIALDTETLLKRTDLFGVNLIELLFNMVNQIYQKGPNEFDGEVEMNSCTILMGYLLENNYKKWDQNVLKHMWQVIKFNLLKARSKILKALNAQLICLFIWNNPQKAIQFAVADNLLTQMIVCILNSEIKIKQQHERQRIILGLSQLIALQNKPQQMMPYLSKLFNLAILHVKKNCDYRLDEDCDQNYETQSQDQQEEQIDINKLDFDADEPEDIWDQDYENNYTSKLTDLDEIKYFKDCIQRLKLEQTNFYNQLISLIPVDELAHLDQKMTKAIDEVTP